MMKLYIHPDLHLISYSKWTINRHVMWREIWSTLYKIMLQTVNCLFLEALFNCSIICLLYVSAFGMDSLYSTCSYLCLGIYVPVFFLIQLLWSLQCWSAFYVDGGYDFLLSWWVLVRTPGTRDLYIVTEIILSPLQFTLSCQTCQHLGD